MKKYFRTSIALMKQKLFAQGLGLSDQQKEEYIVKMFKEILETMLGEDRVSQQEYDDWKARQYEDSENEKDVILPIVLPELEDKEARRRFKALLNSMFMDMPQMPRWEDIKTMTSIVPVYGEPIIYTYHGGFETSLDDADMLGRVGYTNLTYLIKQDKKDGIIY